jgi:hypothetical protein
VTVGGAGGTPGGGNAGDPPPNGNADAVDDGGGGGGYSGLLDASQTPLVIAAGGGGSGGGGASFAGGAGGSGDIGSGGGPGGNGFPVSKGGGGGSSSSSGGTLGTGGCFAGDGSGGGFLQGGQGGNSNGHENSSGGGGGGGYYGGGGGGGDCYAAGGGGGSSYGVTGLTNEVNTTAPASVTISWTNATSTSVSCVPGSVLVGVSSTCTATVTDAASTPSVPTGQVNFTASQPDDPFSGSPCTLAPVDGSTDQARCQVTFTPGREPWVKVTGTYTSDTTHTASSGGQPVKVHLRATKTGLMCAPRLAAGQPSTCTATVTDTAPGQASTPTGTVRFSGGSDDSFSASTCALQPVSATTASCQVTDTPPGPGGKDTISARYTSDYSHLGSTGHRTLRVNRP